MAFNAEYVWMCFFILISKEFVVVFFFSIYSDFNLSGRFASSFFQVACFFFLFYLHLISTCGFTIRCMHYLFDMPCRFLYFIIIIAVIVIRLFRKNLLQFMCCVMLCCGRFVGIHQAGCFSHSLSLCRSLSFTLKYLFSLISFCVRVCVERGVTSCIGLL